MFVATDSGAFPRLSEPASATPGCAKDLVLHMRVSSTHKELLVPSALAHTHTHIYPANLLNPSQYQQQLNEQLVKQMTNHPLALTKP